MSQLDIYKRHFNEGRGALEDGRLEEARNAFFLACRALYRLAKDAGDYDTKVSRLDKAKRLYTTAMRLEGKSGSPPHENAGLPPNSSDRETGEKASRWQLAEKPKLRFSDIAGLDDVKQMIARRILFPFKNRDLAERYRRTTGAGVLMYGPPGTGKTMIARAIAGELDAPFFNILSSEIMSKWVGEAEQNLRDLFLEARKSSPAVLFFDETEALIGRRGTDSPVMNRLIPEFLAQVDGVATNACGLLLLGATNRPWDIDPAALRSGRFGEHLYIPLPDVTARRKLIQIRLSGIPGYENLALDELARRTEGLSGADINGLADRIVDPVFERAMRSGNIVPIETDDVEAALVRTRPSVKEDELRLYDEYRNR
ncbi:MAG TPA: hypothetical protein DEB39_00950 [Planctomycetaceae bacterium]|nr:hypothetical protein [Planctomycetaceae bacterium]